MANRRFIDFPIATTVGDSDIILIWQSGVNKQTTKATFLSGLPTDLQDLNDVAISGLTNGQILRYDSTTGKWENTDQGNLDLNDLNDVSIVSPSNGQVLVYNSSTSKWENSSGGFVPYVGAVTTVDLGAQGLRAGYVRFDTSVVTVPDEQGLMYWDATKSTVALIMNGTLQHIGQDTFFYCKNSTGSSIPKGTSVRFAGTDGASGHILITPFLANGSVPSNYFIGVTAEVIANGAFGQVMHFGELGGINTSGYTAGALLYASTTVAGAFQTTAPVAPNNIVLVAAAVNSKNNGAIVVRPTYGSNINTDEGVKITSPTTGDLLQLQAGGLWENKTLAQVIGSAYVPSTRTITINGTTQDLSANRTFNVGDMLLDTIQTVIARKDYNNNTLQLVVNGTSQKTVLTNSPIDSGSYSLLINAFGFNASNNLYFSKGGNNNGIFAFSNTATRTYTLKDASGTLAFTSDIPSLSGYVQGSGTTNYLPKFTGASTIGNSQVFDNGTNVGIGTIIPSVKLHVQDTSSQNPSLLILDGSNTGRGLEIKLSADGLGANGSAVIYNTRVGAPYGEHIWQQAGTQRMRLDNNGNLGLGVTPSAWGWFTASAFQVRSAFMQVDIGNNAGFGRNAFQSSSGWLYQGNGFATMMNIEADGAFKWFNSPSGTAGNAITFTQSMTLTSGGNLLVGTTTDNGARLQVSGAASISATNGYLYLNAVNSGGNESGIFFQIGGSNKWEQYTAANDSRMVWYSYASSSVVASLSSTGAATFSSSVTAGDNITTSKSQATSTNISVTNTSTANGAMAQISVINSALSQMDMVAFGSGSTGTLYGITKANLKVIRDNSLTAFSNGLAIGTDAAVPFYVFTNSAERMRITSGGNVGIGNTPSDAYTGYKLQIGSASDSQTFISIGNSTSGLGPLNGLVIGNDSTGADIYQRENLPLRLHTNNAEQMRITSGGNVLIGTTTDNGARLHVNGDIRTAAPTQSPASNFRIGTITNGSVSSNAYIRADINGVPVNILIAY